jgi:beta-lactam-binding protein with PASTA domain
MRRHVAGIAVLCGLWALALAPTAGAYKVPKTCKVPNVVGKSLSSAKAAITKAKCTVGTVTLVKSSAPKGTVTAQSPKGGKTVKAGTKVNLTESNGPTKPPPKKHKKHKKHKK